MLKVVISILNWNSLDKTIKCLESIKENEGTSLTICVTDNNSSSFQEVQILRVYPEAIILTNNENVGFAAGHLKALNHAKEIDADLFWILNNDLTIKKDTLKHLLIAYKKNGKGLFGSSSVNPHGDIEELGMWTVGLNKKSSFKEIARSKMTETSTVVVSNIFGYSYMIPMEVIHEFGFMDTSFFLYYEETDYCLRLLANGIPSYWVGASVVYHEKQGSSSSHPILKEVMEYYLYRNLFILLSRHGSISLTFQFLKRFVMRFLSANIARKTKVPKLTKKHLLGILHGFTGNAGTYFKPEDFI